MTTLTISLEDLVKRNKLEWILLRSPQVLEDASFFLGLSVDQLKERLSDVSEEPELEGGANFSPRDIAYQILFVLFLLTTRVDARANYPDDFSFEDISQAATTAILRFGMGVYSSIARGAGGLLSSVGRRGSEERAITREIVTYVNASGDSNVTTLEFMQTRTFDESVRVFSVLASLVPETLVNSTFSTEISLPLTPFQRQHNDIIGLLQGSVRNPSQIRALEILKFGINTQQDARILKSLEIVKRASFGEDQSRELAIVSESFATQGNVQVMFFALDDSTIPIDFTLRPLLLDQGYTPTPSPPTFSISPPRPSPSSTFSASVVPSPSAAQTTLQTRAPSRAFSPSPTLSIPSIPSSIPFPRGSPYLYNGLKINLLIISGFGIGAILYLKPDRIRNSLSNLYSLLPGFIAIQRGVDATTAGITERLTRTIRGEFSGTIGDLQRTIQTGQGELFRSLQRTRDLERSVAELRDSIIQTEGGRAAAIQEVAALRERMEQLRGTADGEIARLQADILQLRIGGQTQEANLRETILRDVERRFEQAAQAAALLPAQALQAPLAQALQAPAQAPFAQAPAQAPAALPKLPEETRQKSIFLDTDPKLLLPWKCRTLKDLVNCKLPERWAKSLLFQIMHGLAALQSSDICHGMIADSILLFKYGNERILKIGPYDFKMDINSPFPLITRIPSKKCSDMAKDVNDILEILQYDFVSRIIAKRPQRATDVLASPEFAELGII